MKYIEALLVSAITICASPVHAQLDVKQQLHQAAQLFQQGQCARATEVAEPLMGSPVLTELEQGRGWALIASAYQCQGRFQDATTCYERALRILRVDDGLATDYAATLGALGTLLSDMGQGKAALRTESRALQIYERIHDRPGIAVACASLADLELGFKHLTKARAYLERSTQESSLTNGFTDDYYAFLSSSRAWLAEQQGDVSAAISGYREELEQLIRIHGEHDFLVGWAYMLLGKAYLLRGCTGSAMDNMEKGLAILRETVGTANFRYLGAQIVYAQALDSSGMHREAKQLRTAAQRALDTLYKGQCVQCRVSAIALR
jgi:tetratricopeptide (TPR) repeat protein